MPVSVSSSRLIYDALKGVGVRVVSALPETWPPKDSSTMGVAQGADVHRPVTPTGVNRGRCGTRASSAAIPYTALLTASNFT